MRRTFCILLLLFCSNLTNAQNAINNLQVYGGSVNVYIQQVAGAVLGGSAQSATVDGDNLYFSASQYGSDSIHNNIHIRDDANSSSEIIINQGAPNKFVANSQANITIGQRYKASSQQIEINQNGSNAFISLNVATSGPVANADIKISQEDNSSLNMYIMKGANQLVNVQQSSNDIANIISNGNNFQVQVKQAPSTSVNITNTGSFNSYNITTQKAGDSANLTVYGSNNQFNLDFGNYKSVSFKTTPSQSVNGGNFMIGPLNTLFDANNLAGNINAAANAMVVKR